jgi:UPF0716 protein FxsA
MLLPCKAGACATGENDMAIPKWVLIFVLVPVLELYVLIVVGGLIGAWATIALVLLTAIVGLALLRLQGMATFARGMRRLGQGQIPAGEMIEGMLLAVAGAFLLTPGFLTDIVGFVLLVPATRAKLSRSVLGRFQLGMLGPRPQGSPKGAPQSSPQGSPLRPPGSVIEGDYERRDDSCDGPRG